METLNCYSQNRFSIRYKQIWRVERYKELSENPPFWCHFLRPPLIYAACLIFLFCLFVQDILNNLFKNVYMKRALCFKTYFSLNVSTQSQLEKRRNVLNFTLIYIYLIAFFPILKFFSKFFHDYMQNLISLSNIHFFVGWKEVNFDIFSVFMTVVEEQPISPQIFKSECFANG